MSASSLGHLVSEAMVSPLNYEEAGLKAETKQVILKCLTFWDAPLMVTEQLEPFSLASDV